MSPTWQRYPQRLYHPSALPDLIALEADPNLPPHLSALASLQAIRSQRPTRDGSAVTSVPDSDACRMACRAESDKNRFFPLPPADPGVTAEADATGDEVGAVSRSGWHGWLELIDRAAATAVAAVLFAAFFTGGFGEEGGDGLGPSRHRLSCLCSTQHAGDRCCNC